MVESPESIRALSVRMQDEVRTIFLGSSHAVRMVLIGLFAGINVLIEDIPGTGKTTLAASVASACGADFGRIQCTPDLLPGDVTGMAIWNSRSQSFAYKPGSIMHQIVLVDELNRAATRTQAALLEAMQEGGVTVDDEYHPLPAPFFLIATQNPVAFAGTFPLPEAQLDRFGLSFSIGYPDREQERVILDSVGWGRRRCTEVLSPERLTRIRTAVQEVTAVEGLRDYIVELATVSRQDSGIRLGLSPRGASHLLAAARAHAVIEGRDFVTPDDVRSVFPSVCRHRIVLSAEARVEGRTIDAVVREIVRRVPLPTGI